MGNLLKTFTPIYPIPFWQACNGRGPHCPLWPARRCNISPHYLIKIWFWKKKVTEHKMYVLVFSTTFVWNILLKNSARYDQKMQIGLHIKYPSFLSDFNKTRIFSIDFQKILIYETSWKSVRWEPSCFTRTETGNLPWAEHQPTRSVDLALL